jgi:hypothetical protein
MKTYSKRKERPSGRSFQFYSRGFTTPALDPAAPASRALRRGESATLLCLRPEHRSASVPETWSRNRSRTARSAPSGVPFPLHRPACGRHQRRRCVPPASNAEASRIEDSRRSLALDSPNRAHPRPVTCSYVVMVISAGPCFLHTHWSMPLQLSSFRSISIQL